MAYARLTQEEFIAVSTEAGTKLAAELLRAYRKGYEEMREPRSTFLTKYINRVEQIHRHQLRVFPYLAMRTLAGSFTVVPDEEDKSKGGYRSS